jgi:nucleotide-binding universal stress UspA family protein
MKRILLAYDGSECSAKALALAGDLAAKAGATLYLVTAVPPPHIIESVSAQEQRAIQEGAVARARSAAEAAVVKLAAYSVQPEILIREGNAAEQILEAAKETEADLVIAGSHGRKGVSRFLLGSVSIKLAQHAGCSVLIAR